MLRTLRQGVIAAWYRQNGISEGKGDPIGAALSAEQVAAAHRELLLGYLNSGVTDSR